MHMDSNHNYHQHHHQQQQQAQHHAHHQHHQQQQHHAHHAQQQHHHQQQHQQHQQQQQHLYYAHHQGQLDSVLLGGGHALKVEPGVLGHHAHLAHAYDQPHCDYGDPGAGSPQQQPQPPLPQIKTEDDFSVILADVRKTCYSS